jgi:hypothetical protein
MRDHRGLTPLNCGAIKGDERLCRLLVEKVIIYSINIIGRSKYRGSITKRMYSIIICS